ncbi:MAG: hypothetical protein HFE30_02870 [Clostridiales bacterium]|nr:hypothetical protein [Clostridiales bacterium]
MKIEPKSPVVITASYLLFGVMLLSSAVFLGNRAGRAYSAETVVPDSEYENAIVQNTDALQNEFSSAASESPSETPLVNAHNGLLIIDAGHGGEDGGASSADGLIEKELNLAISDDIASLCVLFGVPYKMTREDDRLLYDRYNEYTDYKGRKKSLDLKNRLRFTEESGGSMFLSIHMNKFTDPKYSGLQVYYSPNSDDSRALAEVMQNYVKLHLQKDNDRQSKKATSSIYLLNKMKIPSLLVECGFLSNADECKCLAEPAYRASLACTVFSPILEYFVRNNAV